MLCTCGCGKELEVETFSHHKKDGEFYSEACLDKYYESKQLIMEDKDE